MVQIGTPLSESATRVVLLGSGELGKELTIELARLGCEVIAVDRYSNAPAMQVAHSCHVLDMLNADELRKLILRERPDFVVPEVEAIATDVLRELEATGITVVPSANAVHLTMNRQGIRKLVAEQLGVRTSPYRFVKTREEFAKAIHELGVPCVVKPIMSSSGKGQSTIRMLSESDAAWDYAHTGARGGAETLIVEGYVQFDYEITLLTIQHRDGTSFCEPIGHRQEQGDYRESWQPHAMHSDVLQQCRTISGQVCESLGGFGLFGVEFFIKDEQVYFSEVSPRPHDTGMVTMVSQNLSEFALHARAILGLPIPPIEQFGPSASCPILVRGESSNVTFTSLDEALATPKTDVRLFGKPNVQGSRRMGVGLARGASIEKARLNAVELVNSLGVEPQDQLEIAQ